MLATEKAKDGVKKFRSVEVLRKLMAEYYLELATAATERTSRVAWCTSVGPVELLRALGFTVYFPENHAAMLGAYRLAAECIPRATAHGYSPEICSYLTSDIGAYLGNQTALSKAFGLDQIPRPDVLIYNTNQCRDVQDWLSFYGREFNVPLGGIETPRGLSEITASHLQALMTQYQNLVPLLEEISGTKCDLDRLKTVVASSYRCSQLWEQILRMGEHHPSPITFFDQTIHMAPAVVLRGDPRAEQYYQELLAELSERKQQGIVAVAGERLRLYWEGMPIWGKLRELADFFSRLKVSIVASTYCNSWIFSALDQPDPWAGMAQAYAELFITRWDAYKEQYLARVIEEYQIDAVIFHEAKTCPNNSNCRYGLPLRLKQQIGIPSVIIQGDLNDLRLYSAEQAQLQIEALVEQIICQPRRILSPG